MKPAIAIPATALLVYRAWSRKSLTPLGIIFAALTAIIHALHPSSVPFALLVVFFLGGTRVTKIKHNIKANLTVSATGLGGGEGPRTHIQVLANSAAASLLILLDILLIYRRKNASQLCFQYGSSNSLLMVGIVAVYAAVAADTYSSELGILSKSSPRLITSLTLRKVPRGTNGGVTLTGLAAGALGALTIAATSLLLPFCSTDLSPHNNHGWDSKSKLLWIAAITACGTLGSILDSVLGGLFQATVVDKRSGRVIEGSGGQKVLIHPGEVTSSVSGEVPVRQGSRVRVAEDIANALLPRRPSIPESVSLPPQGLHESRKVETGHDILDNNAVNLLMATTMGISAVLCASFLWEIPIQDILT
ncbi:hypothetical protein FQN57_000772 [Myotisia sp. PD_48]|nr:hypothetical protein FQN57_000772 [Myotisia sp. PD_48]